MTHSRLTFLILAFFIFIPSGIAYAEKALTESIVHTDSIDALCATENYLVTGSFDGSIKKVTLDKIQIIGKHNDWVRGLLCIDNNIVSASNDGRIIIWHGTAKLNEVLAHKWWITDVAFYKNRIISVSLDETIKVWSYPELELLFQHKIWGSAKHYTVTISNDKAFIGSTWGISVLDLNTYNWILKNKRITKDYSAFLSSAPSGEYVYFGNSTGSIYQFTTDNAELQSKFKVSNYAIKALSYHDNTLFIGSDDGCIHEFKPSMKNTPKFISKSPESVRAILVNHSNLYAGYDKGILRKFAIDNPP